MPHSQHRIQAQKKRARFQLAAVLLTLLPIAGHAEILDPNLRRLVCKVSASNANQADGLGLIVGVEAGDVPDRRLVYVLTAGHILVSGGKPMVAFGAASPVPCSKLDVKYSDSAAEQKDSARDYALLACQAGKKLVRGLVLDVLTPEAEWKRGKALQAFRNDLGEVNELTTGLSLRAIEPVGVFYNNLFGLPLAGASGGPLIDNKNRVIALCLQEFDTTNDPKVLRTTGLATPIKHIEPKLPKGAFHLRNRSRNAPFQQPGQFELAVDSAMIFASNLGFVNAAPRFRLSTPFPFRRHFSARFDFFTAGNASALTETRFTGFNSHVEAALGPRVGWLRRSNALGGLYTSGGAAVLKSTVRLPGFRINQTKLTPSWEVGWRYRLPRRNWGFAASYQRMWMQGDEARRQIPYLQGLQVGLFAVLGQ